MERYKNSCYWDIDGNISNDSDEEVFFADKERMLHLFGDINALNCASVAFVIDKINKQDDAKEDELKTFERKPIKLYINSFGGSVYDMWFLADTIAASKTPVHTVCTGYAMSAAFVIFLAGHRRYMSRHATLMYHQIYCWRSGKYQDLVDDRKHTDFLNEMIEDYVVERTKLPKKDLLKIREKKRDTYFSAEEAKELGITDEILNSLTSAV